MLRKTLLLNFALLLLGLSGCSTVPMAEAPQNKALSWEEHAKNLSNLTQWDLKGLMAIHSSNENLSANLQWQQTGNRYTIFLIGPLGANSLKLTGTSQLVQLDTSDGKKFQAKTPEALLFQQLGWNLPVSNLFYWIRGLPAPNTPAQKTLDAYHHLTALSQDGWQIQFLRYTTANNLDLPSKIFLTAKDLSIKIIISQW